MSYSKETLKNIVQTITTTIDDNVTAASIVFFWEGSPETLKYLFYVVDADVVVAVDDPNVRSMRYIQDVPEHYPAVHTVSIVSIDKTGVTATIMQEKMRIQMRATVEAAAQTAPGAVPAYTLKILNERPYSRRLGGIDKVWRTDYFVQYADA